MYMGFLFAHVGGHHAVGRCWRIMLNVSCCSLWFFPFFSWPPPRLSPAEGVGAVALRIVCRLPRTNRPASSRPLRGSALGDEICSAGSLGGFFSSRLLCSRPSSLSPSPRCFRCCQKGGGHRDDEVFHGVVLALEKIGVPPLQAAPRVRNSLLPAGGHLLDLLLQRIETPVARRLAGREVLHASGGTCWRPPAAAPSTNARSIIQSW